jgi:hypothetical protein
MWLAFLEPMAVRKDSRCIQQVFWWVKLKALLP